MQPLPPRMPPRISRRLFLAGSAAVLTGGAVVLGGCSDDESADPGSGSGTTGAVDEPTTGSTAVAPTEPTTPVDTPAPTDQAPTTAAIELAGDPFTLGVASGDPTDRTVVLWTRLAPDPSNGGGMPVDDVDVRWEVSAADTFDEVTAEGIATATAAHGHSVHVAAELDPGWWFYRFRAGGHTSPVGRTRTTAPSGEAGASEAVRFASASCQNYQDGFYTAHRDIADQQVDFVAFLGDYIYEGGAATIGENFVVRTHGTDEATTLEAYRNRYALYKADADLQAAHASCPWYVTWDDHEVENNYAGLVPQNPADESTFAERRRSAYQVWWEHQPVALPPPDSAADDYTIYRSARWGDLVDLVVLDGRQYRTDQACGDPGLSLDPPCPETFDESRTMLGDVQEAWLLDTLGSASATWQVIAQQTVFGDVTLGGAVLNYDQWDGYPFERNRIVDALDPAKNTVVLTGDIHFAGAGTIRQGGRGTGTPVAAEFVATSISSGGLVDPAVTEVVRAIPDIVDVELEHRGYILHTVTPDRWSAEYRMVETVKEPGAPMFVHATYVIDAGTNTARFA
jgi:alkaline phosphatase D